VRTQDDLFEVFTQSSFLADFRTAAAQNTRGCIVLERPDLVQAIVTKHTAKDSTIRQTAMAEIESMTPRTSQWRHGEEIPEKHWMYWLAKKFFFNDFGVYRQLEQKLKD